MKKKLFLLFLLLTCLNHVILFPATLEKLNGSYVNLPKKLRELTLLDGAIALKTKMIQRLISTSKKINLGKSPSDSTLLRGLFHETSHGQVELSKANYKEGNYDDFITTLINNLACVFLAEKLNLDKKNRKILFPLIKTLPGTLTSPSTFLTGHYTVSRLTLLAALWSIQENLTTFDYLSILKKSLEKNCSKLLKNNSLKENVLKKIEEIQNEAAKIISKPTQSKLSFYQAKALLSSSTIINQLDSKRYENLALYIINSITGLDKHPPIINQVFDAVVTLDGNQYSFPDCVENAIRNLVNMLAYDNTTKKISKEILQKNAPNARPELLQFYTDYNHFELKPLPERKENPTPEEETLYQEKERTALDFNNHSQKSYNASNKWAQMLSNLPMVRYSNPEGYDMEPTWANLIITTSYLLGLPHPEAYPSDPIAFTEKNINAFVELFKNNRVLTPEEKQAANEKTFDKPDVIAKEDNGTYIIEKNNGAKFKIGLAPDHGFMAYEVAINEKLPLDKTIFIKYPSLWLIIPTKYWPILPPSPLTLYAHPIDNENYSTSLYNNLKYIPISWFKQLAELLKAYAPPNIYQTKKAHFYNKVISTLNPNEPINPKQKNAILEKIFNYAKKLSNSSESQIVHLGYGIINTFAKKLLMIDKVTQYADDMLFNQNGIKKLYGVKIFEALIKEGKEITRTIQTAENLLMSNKNTLQGKGNEILDLLITNQENIASSEFELLGKTVEKISKVNHSITLPLKELLKNKTTKPFVIQAIKNIYLALKENSNDSFYLRELKEMLCNLFKEQLGIIEALEIIEKIRDRDTIQIINKLLKANPNPETLRKISKIAANLFKDNQHFQDFDYDLEETFTNLFKKGYGFEELIPIIQERKLTYYDVYTLKEILNNITKIPKAGNRLLNLLEKY